MIKVCIVGYGNIGKAVLQAVRVADDMQLVGVVRRNILGDTPRELLGIDVTDDVRKLAAKPDVAILCAPSRSMPDMAKAYLWLGINTVDSYDIHDSVWDVREILDKTAKNYGTVSIIAAGWDPGSDSIVRALMQACAPQGITYTNFGPGMSMGHTVAAKAVAGVRAALAVTLPLGAGMHRRVVYVELQEGSIFSEVAARIKGDAYFQNDDTQVIAVEDVTALADMGHGVEMTRKGVSGSAQNQRLSFSMSVNNPAMTGQNLVNCARASMKQQPGAYTMIEIPIVDLLPGSRESLIRKLV